MPNGTEDLIKRAKAAVTELGVAPLEAGATPTAPTADTTVDLLTRFEKFLTDPDFISSITGPIEQELEAFTTKQEERFKTAEEKRAVGIEAGAERLAGEITERGERKLTAFRERQGFAVNRAVIRQIEEDTQKSLKDLELRKQEALGSGQVVLADKLAALEFDALRFEQTAKQQAFSRTLQIGQFGLGVAQLEQQQQQISFQNQVSKLNFLSQNRLLGELTPENQATLEQQFNLPSGILGKIKPEAELNLRTVGDSIVNITTDDAGNVKADVLFTAPSAAVSFGLGLSQTEILGEINQAVSQINLATPDQVNAVINQIPAELTPFVQLKRRIDPVTQEESIVATLNEPNKSQFEEIASIRRQLAQSGLTQADETEIQNKIGITAPEINTIIDSAIEAGDSIDTIVSDLVNGFNLKEETARRLTVFRVTGKLPPRGEVEAVKKAEEEKLIPVEPIAKPISEARPSIGGVLFQPTTTKTEAEQLAEENARRAKLGFPPLTTL